MDDITGFRIIATEHEHATSVRARILETTGAGERPISGAEPTLECPLRRTSERREMADSRPMRSAEADP
jgi:hypothetical protein